MAFQLSCKTLYYIMSNPQASQRVRHWANVLWHNHCFGGGGVFELKGLGAISECYDDQGRPSVDCDTLYYQGWESPTIGTAAKQYAINMWNKCCAGPPAPADQWQPPKTSWIDKIKDIFTPGTTPGTAPDPYAPIPKPDKGGIEPWHIALGAGALLLTFVLISIPPRRR